MGIRKNFSGQVNIATIRSFFFIPATRTLLLEGTTQSFVTYDALLDDISKYVNNLSFCLSCEQFVFTEILWTTTEIPHCMHNHIL